MTNTGRKYTLIKGIAHTMNRRQAIGIATPDNMAQLDSIAKDRDVIAGVKEDTQAMKNFIIKVLSDSGSEDPVGQADAVIAAVQSGQSVRNFLAGADNASPGQRPGIITTRGSRNRGYTNQSTGYGRQAPGQATVHGQDDSETPDYSGNPKSPGDGYAYEAGHERYGSTGVGGTGEDRARSGVSTTRSPRDDRSRTFGHSNPSHPTASPGLSGNYGTGSRVETRKHTHPTLQKNPYGSDYRSVGLTKLEEEERRKEEAVEEVSAPTFQEDEAEALARLRQLKDEENEFRRLADEEEDDETHLEYEAKANGAAELRKQLQTKLSIATGLATQSIEKQVFRKGRTFTLEK